MRERNAIGSSSTPIANTSPISHSSHATILGSRSRSCWSARGISVLVVGNEGEAYAPLAGLPGLDIALAQSMSLMGQDR